MIKIRKAERGVSIDYRAVRGRTVSLGKRDQDVARVLGIEPQTLSRYYTKGVPMAISWVYKICSYLQIPHSDISEYFKQIFS